MGYVYFISDLKETIKIGYTRGNPINRLKQLNTGSPFQLYLLGFFRGTLKDEDNLHKKFANLKVRSNGEWFKISEELVNFINNINEIKDKYVYLDEESKIWLLDRIELVN